MSMWAFVMSWFTPTSIFLFVNLMIGTIVLSSRFGAHKKPQHQQEQEQLGHQLVRVPSLLDRVRSINFSHYKFEQPNPEPEALRPTELEYVAPQHANPDNSAGLTRTPSLLDRLKSMDFSYLLRSEQPDPESKIIDPNGSEHEAYDRSPRREDLVHRSKSDSGGGATVKQHEKMKKSATEKSPLGEFEGNDAVEDRSPMTARVEKTRSFGGDDGVDAKADDFINRFKQQLRLQRLDSLLRYKRNA